MNLKPNLLLIIRRKEEFVYDVNESAGGGVKHRCDMHEGFVVEVVVGGSFLVPCDGMKAKVSGLLHS